MRRSRTQGRLLARLYLERLALGDLEPVFRALVGETAALSPTSILRTRQEWADEYQLWRQRALPDGHVFADARYLRAGLKREKTAVVAVLGVRDDDVKELLAMLEGHRESTTAWVEVLRDRGLETARLLPVDDEASGWWAALDQGCPTDRHQRCGSHSALDLRDKPRRRLHAATRTALRVLNDAPTRDACTQRWSGLGQQLRVQGRADAACLERDSEDFITLDDVPQGHWLHLRTTNPFESLISGVRLRTATTERLPVRDNVRFLVLKLVTCPSMPWGSINGPSQLTGECVHGGRVIRPLPPTHEAAA